MTLRPGLLRSKIFTHVGIRATMDVTRGQNMKVSELKQILKKNDCYFYRQGSRHEIWISRKTGKKFQVPRHGTQDVPPETLKSIKESAGIE